MDNTSWMKSTIDDLVFENRNKSYGAFYLRRLYDKHMSRGILIAVLAFLLLIFAPYIYAKYKEFLASQKEDLSLKEVTLAEPPPLDPKTPPPPPPPEVKPPPVKDQIKFVPPKVQKDEEVVEEEPPPIVEDLKDKVIATETIKGEEGGDNDESVDEPVAAPAKEIEEDPDEHKVFSVVQQQPEFPDGQKALLEFLRDNIKYPTIARENNIEGKVVVRFVVSKTGDIRDAQVLRGVHPSCDAEALRVVNAMPKWKPGKNNGKAVNVTFTLPVQFKLQ